MHGCIKEQPYIRPWKVNKVERFHGSFNQIFENNRIGLEKLEGGVENERGTL